MEKPSFPNPFPEPERLTPPPSLAADLPVWDIRDFFKTTGDALMKLDCGIFNDLLDYKAHLAALTATREPSTSVLRFAGEVDAMVEELLKYRQRLVGLRGKALFLETSHQSGEAEPHRLKPKNPRPTP